MAEAVGRAFDAGEHLLVEAGTGVGKSFAYLVPAIERATKHGGRVVISTHTIALQEQLIEKDIPFLQSVFPQEFSAVLVKGRSNYLGIRRLARASAKQNALFDAKGDLAELRRIEDWAYQTQDGSLSDLSPQPSLAVWERAKSDADDCMGRKCPHYNACFYQRARRRAATAQLLIVNHALLFSDLAVREQGASILPDYDYLVLDEAHTVESVAGDHLGLALSNAQVRFLLNNLHNERTGRGLLLHRGSAALLAAVGESHRVAESYFEALQEWHDEQSGWNGRLREPPPVAQNVSTALVDLREQIRDLREKVEEEEDRSELNAAMERCTGLAGAIERWHNQTEKGWVYWLEMAPDRGRRATLSGRPIDVGPTLKTALFDPVKSVVLTSATLTTASDEPFAYLQQRLSLTGTRSLSLGSPFDYRKQLKVYVEAGMPDPSNVTDFTAAACEGIKKYVEMSRGRAFVLFTSYDMMQRCAKELTAFFEKQEMPLLVQGTGLPRSMMLQRFRNTPRSVLFGTDTFWAGVDVPGEALSNVIIVKLPFGVPNHPMIEARIEQIRDRGGNPFTEYQIPEAILKFRQGMGRLIRTRTDTGIVVILDPRVRTKPYGKRFLAALPDCEVVIRR